MRVETFSVGPLGCNCSIVADESTRRAVVIDPGGDFDRIRSRIENARLTVEMILHTHAHIDHVGATAALGRFTGARARMHEAEELMTKLLPLQAAMIGLPCPESIQMETDLAHELKIDLGFAEITVIHTPGHSPGSVSFLLGEGDQSVLFSGDTLFRHGVGRTDLWGGDHDALVSSIRDRLYVLQDSTRVIPGHGDETTLGEEKRANPFVRIG